MRIVLLSLSMIGLASPVARAEDASDVAKLVRDLEHDEFERRRIATRKLVALGDAAVPALIEAAKSERPETRHRANRILNRVVHRDLVRRFAEIGRTPDHRIDVEEGMWLIAKIVDPLADRVDLERQLAGLAGRVRARITKQLGKPTRPADVPSTEAIAALRFVLFETDAFNGNVANYDDPLNSSLPHVLKTREGLPILLSHVVIAVARRADIPIRGLAVPGRYMCYYDASKRAEGAGASRVIDPFGAGRVMTLEAMKETGYSVDALEPDGARTTLVRMLVNLRKDYEQAGRDLLADRVATYIAGVAAEE